MVEMNEEALSDVFQALSDPTRRGIVDLLRTGPRCAGDLAQAFPLAKSTLSAHFAALRHAGLVDAERCGRSIIYRLTPAALEEVVETVNGWLEPVPASGSRAPHALPVPPTGAWAPAVSHVSPPGARTPVPAPAPPERPHPPRHGEPERTRRRGAASALLVEGALAVLLARLTGGSASQPPSVSFSARTGGLPDETPPAPSAPGRRLGTSGTRRRSFAHLVRFTPEP